MRAAGLVFGLLLLPMAGAQASDPNTGNGEDLTVSDVTLSSARFRWTWIDGCAETVKLVLRPHGMFVGNASADQRFLVPAHDGAMEFVATGLMAGTTYDAHVEPASQCGMGFTPSNTVTFIMLEGDPARGDDAVGAVAVAAGLLGLVVRVRRRR